MPRQQNRLSRSSQRKLEDWLESRWSMIIDKHWTKPDAAAVAKRELGEGFDQINENHISGACNALDKTWPNGRTNIRTKPISAEQHAINGLILRSLQELRKEIGAQVPSVDSLADAVNAESPTLFES